MNERQYKKGIVIVREAASAASQAPTSIEQFVIMLAAVGKLKALGLNEEDVKRLQKDLEEGVT